MRSDIEIEDPPLDISWGGQCGGWSVVCATIQLIDFGEDPVRHKLFVSFPVIAVPDASRSTIEPEIPDRS